MLTDKLGLCLAFLDGFNSGVWLTSYNYPIFTTSITAATAWFIWKARCDAIFRNISINYLAALKICSTSA